MRYDFNTIRSIPSNWDITSRIFAFTKPLADSIIMAQQEKKETVQCDDAQNFLAAFVRADKKQKNRPDRLSVGISIKNNLVEV